MPKSKNFCTAEGCERDAHGGGLCLMHYKRVRNTGRLQPLTAEERFWLKVDKSAGPYECWPWIGFINPKTGYGQFPLTHSTLKLAHRLSYEWAKGEIPEGLSIDHLCRKRACVNPAHLEAVTNRENLMRGSTHAAKNLAKTHCPQGHPYDEANTHIRKDGARTCRTCSRINMQRHRASKR